MTDDISGVVAASLVERISGSIVKLRKFVGDALVARFRIHRTGSRPVVSSEPIRHRDSVFDLALPVDKLGYVADPFSGVQHTGRLTNARRRATLVHFVSDIRGYYIHFLV